MNVINGLVAVLLFELRRTLTIPRIAIWIVFATFPPLLIWAFGYAVSYAQRMDGGPPVPPQVFGVVLYVLIPEVSCMAGVLFWMAPAIQGELESKTWTYLAVRPYGRRTVILGKYLTAMLWSISGAAVALCLSVPIAKYYQPELNFTRTFLAMMGLSVVSSLGRGAIYSVFAVALPQRAMVFAFVYTIVFEYFVGFIPAIINQLTVQFHMRCLLKDWMGWRGEQLPQMIFDDAPSWRHLLALLAYVAIVVPSAILLLERRQFPSSEEG